MIPSDLVAVDEQLGQSSSAGAIVWWRLSGATNLEELKDAWLAANLPPGWLPSMPSPSVAANRAVATLKDRRQLIRSLPKGGWAVVREATSVDGEELEYHTEAKISLDQLGRMRVTPANHPIAAQALEQYAIYQVEITTNDVSSWLSNLVQNRMDGLPLRDSGGIYLVPHFELAQWRAVCKALRAASAHTLNSVPAMRSDDAVAAILDALSQEASAEFASMQEALDSNELGAKALKNRAQATYDIEGKLRRYEAMLGTGLESLHERASQLRAALAIASIRADDDGAAAVASL